MVSKHSIMVKNSSDEWRMRVDFTYLNLGCQKDPYPLLSINKLIDDVSGYKTLSFRDAYFEYNQIKMDSHNAPKIDFMTNLFNYHYKVMPFCLKNACITYQRSDGLELFRTCWEESKGLHKWHGREDQRRNKS